MKSKLLLLYFVFTASACEEIIKIQGNVYDSDTKEPVENVRVVLVVNKKDTLRNIHFEFDTLSYAERKALRKQGVKDSYKDYTGEGLSINSNAFTDKNGNYAIGQLVLPAVFKTSHQLVFMKTGYYSFTSNIDSITHDSLKVYLKREF